ncbi:MAG: protein translocase subunit SecD [Planctomycetota bacterium]
MHDPNRAIKWLLVVGLVVISLVVLYPPSRKMKGGIDLVGGTSLLYEIDTTGLEGRDLTDVSGKVMRVLKDRVDPQSQLNIEWRPVGKTRLEIRMPRPPEAAIVRRKAKEAAIDRIKAMGLRRFDIESALNSPTAERGNRLKELTRGVSDRTKLLESVEAAYLSQKAADESGDSAVQEAASTTYEKAIDDLMGSSLPLQRFLDILTLGKKEKRETELEKLRTQYPAYDAPGSGGGDGALTATVKAHDDWAADKSELEDPSDLKRRLQGAGVLEFRILADRDPESPGNTKHTNPLLKQSVSHYTEQLAKYGPRPKAGDRYRWFPIDDLLSFTRFKEEAEFEAKKSIPGIPIMEQYAGGYYVLIHNDTEFGLLRSLGGASKWALRRAYPDQDPLTGKTNVSFVLDPRGGRLFRELTGNNVERDLCIMLDDEAMSYANIREAIGERCQISGDFTLEKVQNIVRVLEAGSLPARLKETPLAEQTIGPSLGKTNRDKGIRAALYGCIAVLVFVVFYYGFVGGGVANIALALNLLFTLAIMALMQATFTLPGIAGLILTVGMAIDANVLIFERIREERARGVVFKKALNLGYEKAFSAILDGNLTTLITAIILGFVGSEEIKGFAIALGLGLITSMFTALTVTRLIFNSLVAVGALSDLSMRKLIGVPQVDWINMRRIFWPISMVAVVGGVALFFGLAASNKERIFDIEFLGGTSVQIDLKPEFKMTDEQVAEVITESGADKKSAVQWLQTSAQKLRAAQSADGEVPGQYTLVAAGLSGEQLGVLMRATVEKNLERGGVMATGETATFVSKPNELTLATFKEGVQEAAARAEEAAGRMRRARVQVVGDPETAATEGQSFEVVTTETSRPLVQAAILAAMGEKLKIQKAIAFTSQRDEEKLKERYFVVEGDDHYLSDVLGTDANFDVRAFRGGVAIDVRLADVEPPVEAAMVEERLNQVGLQPEFEQHRTRDLAVFPLGTSTTLPGGKSGYRRFAVVGVDEALHFEEDPTLWGDSLAKPMLAQVEAALGNERSLSKVVQFAPQIATQTGNKAIFGLVLSFIAIAVYVWMRFGTQDYGLAVLVALVHDVAITMGALAVSNLIFNIPLSGLLLIEDFKVDLPFIAAILTIIGYSLNDTIVVFDRIRENRGKSGTLSPALINTSLNQTLSRTVLTSLTVFMVVGTLYVFGGAGIHGFAYAMLIGVISGTYSTLAVAVPLVYRPVVLHTVVWIIIAVGSVGIVLAGVPNGVAQVILCLLVLGTCGWRLMRAVERGRYRTAREAALA